MIKYHYFSCDFNSYVYGNIKHKSLAVTESYVMRVLRVCLSHGPLFRADQLKLASDWSVPHIPALSLVTISTFPVPDISDQVCYRGSGDDIAICHDSYDGLMRVTVLSRG